MSASSRATAPLNAGSLCAPQPRLQDSPDLKAHRLSREGTGTLPALVVVAGGRSTRIGEASGQDSRETRVMRAPSPQRSSGGGAPQGSDTRKVVGFVITYTWRREGEYFPVREGKNYIGGGQVSSEADHPECDILIRTDPKMSSEHALLLCRHQRYDLIDQQSSNGTFVGGTMIPIQGIELENYAEITTGSTVWTFVKVEPPAVSPAPPEPQPRPAPPTPSPDKPKTREERPSTVR
jgi:hypothetical protein